MIINYNEKANTVIDCMMIPLLLKFNTADEHYKKVLNEAYDDLNWIKSKLEEKKELIESCYLTSTNSYFVLQLLEWIQEVPDSIDIFTKKIKELKNEEILSLMYDFLSERPISKVKVSREDLFDLIDHQDFTAEKKWRWIRAVHYPMQLVEELSELFLFVSKFYTPYYNKMKNERKQFYLSFDLQNIIDNSPVLNINHVDDLPFDELSLYILSPFFPFFMMMDHGNRKGALLIGMRQTDYWVSKSLDEDQFFNIFKLLSDETRYKVLMMSGKTELKAKNIAKTLGITSGAVSYHVSKLEEEALLVYEIEKDTSIVKQKINENKILQFIEKLKMDLLSKNEENDPN